MPTVLAARGAPEHAGEAALAKSVAARQQARHNPLAAPHPPVRARASRPQEGRAIQKHLDLDLVLACNAWLGGSSLRDGRTDL